MENLVQIQGRSSKVLKKGSLPGVYIKTFGCQMNEYDSEKMYRILEDRYALTTDPASARLIIVNTCSVREKPEHKLYSLLGELRALRADNPELLIGVGGCVAQQEGERIIKRRAGVDFVFGTHNLSLIPALIDQRLLSNKPQVAVDYRDEWEDLPVGGGEGSRASVFVSISRGCNKNCTYCIVPTTRGREVSRDPAEILREVRVAAHRGAREVVLLGQTVNSFGLDLTPRMKFVELLNQVSKVEGIERIRFTSPHPQEVREDFFELVATNPKVCKHIHMPLQSGSDRILKAMNRNYRRKRYLAIIEGLKSRVPDIAISTDVIVGFPGETRDDFDETLDIMRQVEFESSYSFIFSARPGTAAAELEDNTTREVKLERLQELQALQEGITAKKLTAMVGERAEVLLDGFSRSNASVLQGRTSQNFLVNLEEEIEELQPGMIVPVKISAASRYTLRGRLEAGAIPSEK